MRESFEGPSAVDDGEISAPEAGPKKLIESSPKLRHIRDSLELLRPEDVGGERVNWKDLDKNVKPWEDSLGLANNVREVVVDYVSRKIPILKEKIPALADFDDKNIINALTHGYFEEVSETEGQRREVLLTVMAHVVKTIETNVYKKIINGASVPELDQLGLTRGTTETDPESGQEIKKYGTAEVLTDALDACIASDNLFIRFAAFSQLAPDPETSVNPHGLFLHDDETPHPMNDLFHETGLIAKKFKTLSERPGEWQDIPGGDIFKKYLEAFTRLYSEKDIEKIKNIQEEVDSLYDQLLNSDFPIIITPSAGGYRKPPYFDPELKVSLLAPESKEEQDKISKAQEAFAESLPELGLDDFQEKIKGKNTKVVNVLGGFGANLSFNTVAQGDKTNVIFLSEQVRAYDSKFFTYLNLITNSSEEFAGLSEQEKTDLEQYMSRFNTILHEFSHLNSGEIEEDNSTKAINTIGEGEAELVYRALLPTMIDKGGLNGTKKQWACGALAESLQVLREQPDGDDYYQAVCYSVNKLVDDGVVVFDNNQLTINDFDKFYSTSKELAQEIVGIFEDLPNRQKSLNKWVKDKCQPNDKVKQLTEFLRGLEK